MNLLGLPIGLLLLGFGFISLFYGGRFRAVSLHNISWAVAFILVGSRTLGYDEVGGMAWLVMLSGIGAFNVGFALASKPSEPGLIDGPRAFASGGMFLLLLGGYVVGFAAVAYVIGSEFGFAAIFSEASLIRAAGFMAMVPVWARALFYLGSLLGVFALFPEFVSYRFPLGFRLLVVGLVAVGMAMTVQRTLIVVFVLWVVGVMVMRWGSRPLPIRVRVGVVLAFALVLVLFILLGGLVGKTVSNFNRAGLQIDAGLVDSGLLLPAIYVSSGVPALNALVYSTNLDWPPSPGVGGAVFGAYNPETSGLATFGDILRLVPGFEGWPRISPFVRIPMPTNVYTWLEPWWRDFRLPGVLMFGVLFGALLGLVSGAMRGQGVRSVLSGLMVGVSGLACFVNQTLDTFVLIPAVVCVVLGAAGGRPKKRSRMSIAGSHRIRGAHPSGRS